MRLASPLRERICVNILYMCKLASHPQPGDRRYPGLKLLAQVFATKPLTSSKLVLVCQNTACRKQGAAKVLAAFQAYPAIGVTVTGSRCLGQCGNGPMILVTPEQVWYCRVHPDEVPAVVERHLQGGQPVAAMLYPKFHRH
jgi:(2Fe-2S) ferredoxin